MELNQILKTAYDAGASDVHLIANNPPVMRVNQVMTPLDRASVLTKEQVRAYFEQMAGAESRAMFERVKDADFSYYSEGLARYRVNAHMQRGGVGLAMRAVKTKVPPLAALNLPEVIARLTYLPRGLVLVTGDTGSGKTTTLAISAAETGHLVLSTLHTVNASQTVERIIDMYPSGQQNQIRSMLANTLQAVVSQTLFSRVDRPGMIPAVETLLCTPAVRNLIREARTFEIPNVIETSRAIGMCSLDSSIAELYFNGYISREDAIAQAAFPDKLVRQLAA